MCGMCPDYVASCWICTQPMRGHPDKTIGKQFYLEMGNSGKFCEHFIERYKTDSPSTYSHISREHQLYDEDWNEIGWGMECDDNCISEGWWRKEYVREIVEAFNKWGEVY